MKLILGGTGLIGSNFTDGLKVSSKDVNLLKYEQTERFLTKHNPNVVIYSACKDLNSKNLYENPASYFDENVRMSLNVFKASEVSNVKKLVVISSINAFLQEDNLIKSDVYNHKIKKVLSDIYKTQYSLESNIFYLSNVFGPNYKNSHNGFIPFIIEKCYNCIKNKTDMTLIGDMNHRRNFIYVKDVVEIINDNIHSDRDLVLTTNKTQSLQNIVEMVTDIMNFKGNVVWSGQYDNIVDKKIKSYNGECVLHVNKTKIYDALTETIGWYLKNKI
jgi:nucleoside-diphosphate-sugar epimerase